MWVLNVGWIDEEINSNFKVPNQSFWEVVIRVLIDFRLYNQLPVDVFRIHSYVGLSFTPCVYNYFFSIYILLMQRSRASAFNLVYPYLLLLANKTLQTSSFAAAPPVSKTSCLGKSYLLSAPSNLYYVCLWAVHSRSITQSIVFFFLAETQTIVLKSFGMTLLLFVQVEFGFLYNLTIM